VVDPVQINRKPERNREYCSDETDDLKAMKDRSSL
jgi:hypothetical protein